MTRLPWQFLVLHGKCRFSPAFRTLDAYAVGTHGAVGVADNGVVYHCQLPLRHKHERRVSEGQRAEPVDEPFYLVDGGDDTTAFFAEEQVFFHFFLKILATEAYKVIFVGQSNAFFGSTVFFALPAAYALVEMLDESSDGWVGVRVIHHVDAVCGAYFSAGTAADTLILVVPGSSLELFHGLIRLCRELAGERCREKGFYGKLEYSELEQTRQLHCASSVFTPG